MAVQIVVNAGQILADVDIGVAKDTNALPGEVGGTGRVIGFLGRVAIAVDLDDELQLGAVEIGDIGADGFLAQEFVAVELAVT